MNKAGIEEIEKNLEHWRNRKEGLLEWINLHNYEHVNFEQNLRDLRNADCKLIQIKSRLNRPSRNTKAGATSGMPIYSMPILHTHY